MEKSQKQRTSVDLNFIHLPLTWSGTCTLNPWKDLTPQISCVVNQLGYSWCCWKLGYIHSCICNDSPFWTHTTANGV